MPITADNTHHNEVLIEISDDLGRPGRFIARVRGAGNSGFARVQQTAWRDLSLPTYVSRLRVEYQRGRFYYRDSVGTFRIA